MLEPIVFMFIAVAFLITIGMTLYIFNIKSKKRWYERERMYFKKHGKLIKDD